MLGKWKVAHLNASVWPSNQTREETGECYGWSSFLEREQQARGGPDAQDGVYGGARGARTVPGSVRDARGRGLPQVAHQLTPMTVTWTSVHERRA
jgi:hypothetical protein